MVRMIPKLFFGVNAFMCTDEELDYFDYKWGYHFGRTLAHSGVAGNERADQLSKMAVEDVWARQDLNIINRRTAYMSIPWWH